MPDQFVREGEDIPDMGCGYSGRMARRSATGRSSEPHRARANRDGEACGCDPENGAAMSGAGASVEELLARAAAVIDLAFEKGAEVMAPLFSGGHDSLCAVYAASRHPRFDGRVYHIRTRIGAQATRDFVEDVCHEYGWKLQVFASECSYEDFVRESGFPGPGGHLYSYVRLKERCVRQIVRTFTGMKIALITGVRTQESTRRMGHAGALQIGEQSIKNQRRHRNGNLFNEQPKVVNRRRFWTNPCHNWTGEDQRAFMDAEDLPRNPIKMSPLGMSGECFCGAFARPNEIEMIRRYAPDVAEEIDRLTVIAKECGKHSVWGTRPDGMKGVVVSQTGPLCNSCDARAMAAGIIVDRTGSGQQETLPYV